MPIIYLIDNYVNYMLFRSLYMLNFDDLSSICRIFDTTIKASEWSYTPCERSYQSTHKLNLHFANIRNTFTVLKRN